MDAATMRMLYGADNPKRERAKLIASMMGSSGFAKPFLAYAMAKEMGAADTVDAERSAGLKTMIEQEGQRESNKAAMDYGQKVMGHIIDISKSDPVAATQILKAESERGDNPYIKQFQDVTFNAKTSKEGWATVTSNGTAYQVYLPKLQEAAQSGPDSDLYKQTVIQIGNGKPPEAPKSRTVKRGTQDVTEEWDQSTSTWRQVGSGPAWNPDTGDKKNDGQANSAMLTQLTNTYMSKWLPLAIANYKQSNKDAKDAYFLDPYGNPKEAMVRASLTPEQRRNYDRGLIDAQAAVGKGANPAQAVDDVLSRIAAKKATKAGAGAAGSKTQPQGQAELSADGKSVVVDGKTYPIGQDGTVTINGTRYKVGRQ